MQPQNQSRKKIIIIAVLLGIVLIGGIAWLSRNSNKTRIDLIAAPTDSTITIDGQPAKAGKTYFTHGEHTLKATRQYFGDAVKTINTKDYKNGDTIYLLPDPNTPEAQQYMINHPDQQALRERGVAQEVSQTQNKLMENYPILAKLPHQTIEYKIEYRVDNNTKVRFIVTLYTSYPTPDNQTMVAKQAEEYKQMAQQYLKDNGIDPTTADITYTQ